MEATAIEALRAEVAASRHDELRYVPMSLPHKKKPRIFCGRAIRDLTLSMNQSIL
jgi:hypothetical protein